MFVKIFGALITAYVVMVVNSVYAESSEGWPGCFTLRGVGWRDWIEAIAAGALAAAIVFGPATWPWWVHLILCVLAEVGSVAIAVLVLRDDGMYLDQLVLSFVGSAWMSFCAYLAIAPVVDVITNETMAKLVARAPWIVLAIVVAVASCILFQKRKSAADLADPGDTPDDVAAKKRKLTAFQVVAVLLCLAIVLGLLSPALFGWKSLADKAGAALQGTADSPVSTTNGGAEGNSEGGSSGPMVPGEEAPTENGTGSGGDEADSTGNGDEATASQGTADSSASAAGGSEDKPEGGSSEPEAIDGTVPEKGVVKTSDLWYQINASDPQAQPGHFGPSPEIPDDITKEELGDYIWELFKDVVFGTGDYAKPDPNPAISFAFFDDMKSGKRRLDYAYCDNTMNVQQTIVGFLGDQDGGRYETFMNMVVMSIEQYHPQFGAFTGAEVRALGLDLKDQFYADYSAYMNSGGYLELPVVWECGAPADDDLFLRIRYYIKGRLVEEWLSVNCLFQACNASEVLKITPELPSSNTPPGGDPQSQPDDPSDDPPQSSYHKNSTISTVVGQTNSNPGAGNPTNSGVNSMVSAAEQNNPSQNNQGNQGFGQNGQDDQNSNNPSPPPDPSMSVDMVVSVVGTSPGQVTVDSNGAEAAKPVSKEDKPSVALSADDGQPVANATQGMWAIPG